MVHPKDAEDERRLPSVAARIGETEDGVRETTETGQEGEVEQLRLEDDSVDMEGEEDREDTELRGESTESVVVEHR